jgi:hypothetical protein
VSERPAAFIRIVVRAELPSVSSPLIGRTASVRVWSPFGRSHRHHLATPAFRTKSRLARTFNWSEPAPHFRVYARAQPLRAAQAILKRRSDHAWFENVALTKLLWYKSVCSARRPSAGGGRVGHVRFLPAKVEELAKASPLDDSSLDGKPWRWECEPARAATNGCYCACSTHGTATQSHNILGFRTARSGGANGGCPISSIRPESFRKVRARFPFR